MHGPCCNRTRLKDRRLFSFARQQVRSSNEERERSVVEGRGGERPGGVPCGYMHAALTSEVALQPRSLLDVFHPSQSSFTFRRLVRDHSSSCDGLEYCLKAHD